MSDLSWSWGWLDSRRLTLSPESLIRAWQAGEKRCIRTAVQHGMPVDEVCATAVDRYQDEIDRRAAERGGA